jgi:SAM-dependent methyltransferase
MAIDGKISPPSDWVLRFTPAIRAGGTVLDVACGGGRHARYLSKQGFRVTAIDRDVSAMSDVADIEVLEADLEDKSPWPLAGRRFDGVIVTNYLFRPLFPTLTDSVADGGVLVYETFGIGNERFGRPQNPDFLLQPGELLQAVSGRLSVLGYQAGTVNRPGTAVVQRIAAIRRSSVADPIVLPAPWQ